MVGTRRLILMASLLAALVSAPPALAAPPNDEVAHARFIGSLPYTDMLDTTTATVTEGEPTCATGQTHSVWYRFTPSENMKVYVTTRESDYTAHVTVFAVSGAVLTPLHCTLRAADIVALQGATQYIVRVASPSSAPKGGTLGLRLLRILPPSHDDFGAARTIPSVPYVDVFDPATATAAPDDPPCAPYAPLAGVTVWYRLTTAKRTKIYFSPEHGLPAPTVRVYTGQRGALQKVMCNEDFEDFVAQPGKTYHIVAAGSPTVAGIPFSAEIDKFRPGIALSIDKKRVTFGGRVRIKARLGNNADPDNRRMLIYGKTGGIRKLVAAGDMNAKNELVRLLRPKANTSYTAEWAGDARHEAAKSPVRGVDVYARVTTRLTQFYGRSGADALYRSAPVIVSVVRPNHAGRRVWLNLDRQIGSAWQDLGYVRVRLNASSAVAVRVIGLARGYRYRISTTLPGHADHPMSFSPPAYFRVTG